MTQEFDVINKPKHYNSHPKGIECIDVIEENPYFLLSQSLKYIWRVSWGSKENDLEDLKKASFYLNRQIKKFEEVDQGK